MKIGVPNGWTGGQYSILRVIFGVCLLVHFLMLMPGAHDAFADVLPGDASPLLRFFPNVLAIADLALPLLVLAALASLLFILGWHDRIAAVVMAYVLACLLARNPLSTNPSLPFAGFLLLAHACLPPAPFWSLAARGRVDPRGGWHMPPAIFAAVWAVLSLGYTYSGWTKLASPSWVEGTAMARLLDHPPVRPAVIHDLLLARFAPLLHGITWFALGFELLYAVLALFRRARPWIWTAMLIVQLGLILLTGFSGFFLMAVLHLFLFDPAWIRPRAPESVDTVLYDGTCALCHRSVRLLLAEDAGGRAFLYAPLGDRQFDVDSIVVKTADGKVRMRSDAVIHLLHRLGGLWRIFGVLLALVPRPLRNAVYDFIARIRYRIFGRAKNACPLMPPDLRSRFTV
jgi:predicted DCC family thiol-disulfide oxidoreductase YuxK